MEEIWTRLVQDRIDRVSGPMNFRLVMQPLMATVFVLAMILDVVYQFMVSRFVYPARRSSWRSSWRSCLTPPSVGWSRGWHGSGEPSRSGCSTRNRG